MIIIDKILGRAEDRPDFERDTVQLDWEGRQKARQRLLTQAGQEIALALPTGTILTPGDLLYQKDSMEIVVVGIPEKVFVLRAKPKVQFGLLCYQIGNLHRPIGFDGTDVLTPYEPVLENQFNRLGLAYIVEDRIFTHSASQLHSHDH
mgnify:FL=1